MARTLTPAPESQRLTFADFRVDLRTGELRRNGTRIALQDQPSQILVLLASRPGEVVTREELRHHLWPTDTFVDFDNSLNAAIAKLRQALGDTPESPQFIETLPRRGYRFIAPVKPIEEAPPLNQTLAEVTPTKRAVERRWTKRWSFALLLAIVAIGVLVVARRSSRPPKVLNYVQISNDGKPKARYVSFINILVNDGSRIYFAMGAAKGWEVAEVPVTRGEGVIVPSPFEGIVVNDISCDHSKLLVSPSEGTELNSPLWILSLPGGPAERLGNVRAHGSSWSSDGKLLAYAKDRSLYIASADGGEPRMLATFEGIPFQPRWSPDEKVLRFYLYDTKSESGGLWEIFASGNNPHALFPAWPAGSETCCGLWTSDGRYFVFQGTRDGTTHIWARQEGTGLLRGGPPEPVQLTFGPMNFLGPSPSPDGKRVFVIGEQRRGELMRYDSKSRRFVTYLAGISAEGLDFSRDREWVLYVSHPEGTLWRSRVDGSQRLRLTSPSMQVASPRWSPDGNKVAFMAAKPGGNWKLYVIPSEGGTPEELIQSEDSQWQPNWSPKGDSLIFGNPWWSPAPAIHQLDLATRRVLTLPDSEGLYSPRWSPDGRFVAAMSKNSQGLMLFDFKKQKWEELIRRHSIGHLTWSRNSEYIYFDAATDKGVVFYRVRVGTHNPESVAALNPPIGLAFGLFGPWTGLDPDDSPLLMRDTSVQEIYALDMEWP